MDQHPPRIASKTLVDGRQATTTYEGSLGARTVDYSLSTPRDSAPLFRIDSTRVRIGDYVLRRDRMGRMEADVAPNNFGYDEPVAFLGYIVRGDLVLSRGGERISHQRAGSGALVAGWGEYHMSVLDEGVESLSLFIPLRSLTAIGVDIRSTIVILRRPSVLLETLGALLGSVLQSESVPEVMSQLRIRQVLESLLAGIYLENGLFGNEEGFLQAANRRRVLEHIALAFADPSLNTQSIARRVGMSTRSLQRVFEGSGTTLARELLRVRGEHALAMLGDPASAHLTIEEIARRTGFANGTALRRHVEQAKGVTPTEYRVGALNERRAAPTATPATG